MTVFVRLVDLILSWYLSSWRDLVKDDDYDYIANKSVAKLYNFLLTLLLKLTLAIELLSEDTVRFKILENCCVVWALYDSILLNILRIIK